MIRGVSITSRTGFAPQSASERIVETVAILGSIAIVFASIAAIVVGSSWIS